jgi:outer membrane receptor protein involved in Fe transport
MKPISHRPSRAVLAVMPVILGVSLAAPAAAQNDDLLFEEITVTAQKREENIMEVPVSITAVTNADIQASGIKDVFDLQQNVPSLLAGQSQTATTSNFSIRSVGSTSNNFAVESSVGLYVDGVYRSRQSSLINELVDVEAVEVLRGPQGTLFGKNTAAGAILLRTVRPSQDTDAFVELTAGDLGLTRVSAAANIPLSDNVAFRGTVFSSQRDGYIDDLVRGDDFYNDRDRLGVRLQLAGENASGNLDWRLIADYSEIDEQCCGTTTVVDNLVSRASLAGAPVFGSDAIVLQLGGTVITDFPYPAPLLAALQQGAPLGTILQQNAFEELLATYDIAPESQNEDSGISFELNYTMDNDITFTSVSAFRSFDTFDRIDADFVDAPLLERINDATVEK